MHLLHFIVHCGLQCGRGMEAQEIERITSSALPIFFTSSIASYECSRSSVIHHRSSMSGSFSSWYMKDDTRSQSYITEWHPRLTTSFMCRCASIQPAIKISPCSLSKTGLARELNMKDILMKISLTA